MGSTIAPSPTPVRGTERGSYPSPRKYAPSRYPSPAEELERPPPFAPAAALPSSVPQSHIQPPISVVAAGSPLPTASLLPQPGEAVGVMAASAPAPLATPWAGPGPLAQQPSSAPLPAAAQPAALPPQEPSVPVPGAGMPPWSAAATFPVPSCPAPLPVALGYHAHAPTAGQCLVQGQIAQPPMAGLLAQQLTMMREVTQ